MRIIIGLLQRLLDGVMLDQYVHGCTFQEPGSHTWPFEGDDGLLWEGIYQNQIARKLIFPQKSPTLG